MAGDTLNGDIQCGKYSAIIVMRFCVRRSAILAVTHHRPLLARKLVAYEIRNLFEIGVISNINMARARVWLLSRGEMCRVRARVK